MTGAKYLTRLDLSLTHSDSRRTASDRPRILFFTELHTADHYHQIEWALLKPYTGILSGSINLIAMSSARVIIVMVS